MTHALADRAGQDSPVIGGNSLADQASTISEGSLELLRALGVLDYPGDRAERLDRVDLVDLVDLSEILAAISVYRRCLGWSAELVSQRLFDRFGKGSQALLTDQELMEWLAWLATQVDIGNFIR